MQRRKFISLATGSVFGTSGCLNFLSPGKVDIAIINGVDESKGVEVIVSDEGSEVYNETIALRPSENVQFQSVFEGGQYEVSVSVNESPPNRFNLQMNGCDTQTLYITIHPEKTVIDSNTC
ncbi:hypothetical protein [Haloarchaeobius sp. TZWSO28]|uniref:hypothetical protein n=1 Tax=Haloarchaeobius sp. TZWSO28 TaxID=3446119 RepID=UPI003EBE0BC8